MFPKSAEEKVGGPLSFTLPSDMSGSTAEEQGSSTGSSWILLGALILSLAVGLIIVVLKKY